MNRDAFRKFFKSAGPAILPVIHVRDADQAARNVAVVLGEGAQGVFLINHDFPHMELVPVIEQVRERFPSLWLGVNFLGVTGKHAFPVLGDLAARGVMVDAYWADDARIDERVETQAEAVEIDAVRAASGWDGLYFGGTAFKKQREVAAEHYRLSAEIARTHMDAVTTSGIATGHAADISKIETFRQGCGDHPLAIASGVTPENIHLYAPLVDAILVATGINFEGDFYNADPVRLRRLIARSRDVTLCRETVDQSEAKDDRDDRWYLYNMAPTERANVAAWLDPSSVYINARSFNAILDDLLEPFSPDEVDLVAAPDAMGFILGSAMAARLGRGFLALRKAGRLPVEADAVTFTNYSGNTQDMEMRKQAFLPGTRVLIADQWIETGGTMEAAISLIEGRGGIVAGIATICIEESHGAEAYRQRYKCCTAVVSGTELQRQMNSKAPDYFPDYRVEKTYPVIGAGQK